MDIYRADRAKEFTAFILADSQSEGNRRNILSAPPIYTMNEEFLNKFLSKRKIDNETKNKIKIILLNFFTIPPFIKNFTFIFCNK